MCHGGGTAFCEPRQKKIFICSRGPSLRFGISEKLLTYFPAPAAIFFTMASTSLRSLSFKLME
jgi:hypothetical protein